MPTASTSKKRVEKARPSSTLHSYFVSNTTPSKSTTTKSSSRNVHSKSAFSTPRVKKFVPPPEEDIIVIDSSDDDEPHATLVKKTSSCGMKRKVEDRSSDIEFVEDSHTETSKATSAKKVKQEAIDETSTKPEYEASGFFGKPHLLLSSRSGTSPPLTTQKFSALSAKPPAERSHASGISALPASLVRDNSHRPTLLELDPSNTVSCLASPPLRPSSSIRQDTSSSSTISTSRPQDDCLREVVEIDDEWDMGDDEQAQEGRDPTEHDFDNNEDDDEIEFEDPIDVSTNTPSKASTSRLDQDTPKSSSNSKSANAFSVLMSSHKENEAWKEATIAEDRTFRPTKNNGGRRKAPFYKVMTGMPIAVDAFRYGAIPGVTAYFLTHAHSDHYTNLSSNWKAGPIYCSEGTANLIIHMLSVDRKWVHPLPMDQPTVISNTGGVTVTLIEANHCPGSSLFLFEGKQTIDAGDSTFKSPFVGSSKMFRYLHCGDFRASPQHVLHPAVKGKHLDIIYLDTTYLNPKYCFPSQPQVIDACAELAKRIVRGTKLDGGCAGGITSVGKTVDKWFVAGPSIKVEDKGKTKAKATTDKILIVVGTYSIGKERVVKAIARALQTKVYCDSRKAAILRCQSDSELHAMLTKDPYEAGVHLVPLGVVTSDRLKEYTERWKGHWAKAVAFRPTGWTYMPPVGSDTLSSISSIITKGNPHQSFTHANLKPMRNSTFTHELYGVPYSEHSSFYELTCFTLSVDWGRIIATVNVESEGSRGKIKAWVEKWDKERKRRKAVGVKDVDGVVPYRSPEYW